MKNEELREAAKYWFNKDKTANVVSDERAKESIESIINSNCNGVLGTCTNNVPRCTPVDYTYYNGCIYIMTEGGYKLAGIADGNPVAFSIYNNDGTFGNLHSVQIEGKAEVFTVYENEKEYAAVLEARNSKETNDKFKLSVEMIKKLPHNMPLIKIKPTIATVLDSDFTKEGYFQRAVVKY